MLIEDTSQKLRHKMVKLVDADIYAVMSKKLRSRLRAIFPITYFAIKLAISGRLGMHLIFNLVQEIDVCQ